jgi:hypothetical protein
VRAGADDGREPAGPGPGAAGRERGMSSASEKFSARLRAARKARLRVARPGDPVEPEPDPEPVPDLGAGARGGGPDVVAPPGAMSRWIREQARRPPPTEKGTEP